MSSLLQLDKKKFTSVAHSKASSDLGCLHWSKKALMCPFSLGDEAPHSQECFQAEGCQSLSFWDQIITLLDKTNQIGTHVLQMSTIPISMFLSIIRISSLQPVDPSPKCWH